MLFRSGRIHGMIGYGAWTENSCLMHIALDNPACFRSLLAWAFRYLFEMTGRGVAFATVRARNERSMRLCKRIGMREAYRLKDAIAVGEDMVLFEMRREDCRWIRASGDSRAHEGSGAFRRDHKAVAVV